MSAELDRADLAACMPDSSHALTRAARMPSRESDASARVVSGTVQRGDQRGRRLGFPTINIAMRAPAAEGVYAGIVRIRFADGVRAYVAAVSVGRRETYYGQGGELLLEAHLLDFAADVYGLTVTVELRRFVRSQRRFGSTHALLRHMRRDVAAVRRWAHAAGFAGLLAFSGAEAGRDRRRSPHRHEQPRDHTRIALDRTERRLVLLRRAVAAADADTVVDHQYVAASTGLPVGYLEWLYPTVEALRAVAADGGGAVVVKQGARAT